MGKEKRKRSKKAVEQTSSYHVEVIKKARVTANEKSSVPVWEYRVKWAGYPSENETWEPAENLATCDRLVESFWKEIGSDDLDYEVGDELEPSPEWIATEKRHFRRDYLPSLSSKERRQLERMMADADASEQVVAQSSGSASSHAATHSLPQPDDESDSEDDRPLQVPSGPSSPKLQPPKKKRKIVESDGDESDEEPLAMNIKHRSSSTGNKGKERESSARIGQESTVDHSDGLFSPRSSPEIPLKKRLPLPLPKPKTLLPIPKSTQPPAYVPSHLKDPHARMPANQAPQPSSSSGLSTKQRIALGALAPTLPKAVPTTELNPKRTSKPLPTRAKNSSLPALGFKKQPIPTLASAAGASSASPVAPSPTTHFTSASPTSATTPTVVTFAGFSPAPISPSAPIIDTQLTMSPVQQSPGQIPPPLSDTASVGGTDILDSMFIPLSRNSTEVATISPAVLHEQSQADDFLASIMPESLAAPIDEMSVEPIDPIIRPVQTKVPLPGRIPKRYKWTGTLHLARDDPEVCNVKLHDTTQESSQGLRFPIVLKNITRIDMEGLYDTADILSMIPSFRQPPQMGLLSADGERDQQPFQTVESWLTRFNKAFMDPIIFDGNVAGHVLFFPSNCVLISQALNVPPQLKLPGHLIVAILPWTLTTKQISQVPSQPQPLPQSYPLPPVTQTKWERSLSVDPKYHHGLRTFAFPRELYAYFMDPTRRGSVTCSIWDEKPPNSRSINMEVKLLEAILTQVEAKKVKIAAPSRMIFVHYAALRTLESMPALVRRRVEQDTTFVAFGTQEGLSPSSWLVQEIYPTGGVVTFTASAIFRDPIGVRHKVEQISKHPSWTAYILPATLGVLAKLECGSKDPVAELEKGTLQMGNILKCIEDGMLSLMTSPPEHYTDTPDYEGLKQWRKQYLRTRPFSSKESLNLGITAFLEHVKLRSQFTHRELDKIIEEDMLLMQRQPSIMSKYRRYVVVNSTLEQVRCSGEYRGIEWTTARQLDFMDDFFPKQTIGTR